jgi:hypothetical protein
MNILYQKIEADYLGETQNFIKDFPFFFVPLIAEIDDGFN